MYIIISLRPIEERTLPTFNFGDGSQRHYLIKHQVSTTFSRKVCPLPSKYHATCPLDFRSGASSCGLSPPCQLHFWPRCHGDHRSHSWWPWSPPPWSWECLARDVRNSNLKTLILKDSSVRPIWTYLTPSPCYTIPQTDFTSTNKQLINDVSPRSYKCADGLTRQAGARPTSFMSVWQAEVCGTILHIHL